MAEKKDGNGGKDESAGAVKIVAVFLFIVGVFCILGGLLYLLWGTGERYKPVVVVVFGGGCIYLAIEMFKGIAKGNPLKSLAVIEGAGILFFVLVILGGIGLLIRGVVKFIYNYL